MGKNFIYLNMGEFTLGYNLWMEKEHTDSKPNVSYRQKLNSKEEAFAKVASLAKQWGITDIYVNTLKKGDAAIEGELKKAFLIEFSENLDKININMI